MGKTAVVLLLLIHCFMYLTLFVGACVGLCSVMYVSLCDLSSFAIILTRKRESWLLCLNCLPYVLRLLVFCGSSSRFLGLVCSV